MQMNANLTITQIAHVIIRYQAVLQFALMVSLFLISFVMTGVIYADGPATGGSTCSSC